MQRVVRKMGLPFVIIAALTLLTISGASLLLAVGYKSQLHDLKTIIYSRCVQRQHYDSAAHDSAVADLAEQQALVRFTHNPRLRAIFTAKAAKDQRVIRHGVLGNCAQFR